MQRTEQDLASIRQDGIDPLDIVHHVSVADGARTARIVSGHAPDGGLRAGRDIDRIPQPVRTQERIEMVEHDSGLDRNGHPVRIEGDDLVEMPRGVDDDGLADGLAALARSRAAGENRRMMRPRHIQRTTKIILTFRNDHADRHDLIDRGIRRVASATPGVEQDITAQRGSEVFLQPGEPGARLDAAHHALCGRDVHTKCR